MPVIRLILFRFTVLWSIVFPPYIAGQSADTLAFTGARIIEGNANRVIEQGIMVVNAGRITAVGPVESTPVPDGAVIIDLSGCTIMPGIINAHGHTAGDPLDKLERFGQFGITTVVSLGGEDERQLQLRDIQDTPELDRSRIYLAGPVLNPRTPEDARRDVRAAARMGVDWVKIRVNFGDMPASVYRAVIEEAHEENLKVAAHMISLEDTKGLLTSGVDNLAHSIRDTEVDEVAINMIREADICLTPTLTRELSTFVYAGTPDFFDAPFLRERVEPDLLTRLVDDGRNLTDSEIRQGQTYLDMAKQNLARLHAAGVRIAMGTDSGVSPGRIPGFFEHLEMAMMAESGMTPMAIIHAATGAAASCMGIDEHLGTLEPGKWADFIVLEANPLDDILNTQTLESVWIAGNRVH